MNIWLVKTGEPLPSDGKSVRLFRTGIFAKHLAANGHDVTWWSGTFDHQNKVQRNSETTFDASLESVRILQLKSDGYQKNISLKRIIDHKQVAKEFVHVAQKEPIPDIILCAFPTIELCKAVITYSRNHDIPVLIDIRDLWPDTFVERLMPVSLQSVGKIIVSPLAASVHKIMKQATGITSISRPMLDWGLKYAKREIRNTDHVFPFGYTPKKLTPEQHNLAREFFKPLNTDSKAVDLRICLFATLNNSFNVKTLIDAAKILSEGDKNIQFVICGRGEKLEEFKVHSAGLENFFFFGWVNFPTIQYLMQQSDIGVAPYINTSDFAISIPNKAVEYLSGGLPILTSIEGHLTEILLENQCGWQYENDKPLSLSEIISNIANDKQKLALMQTNAKNLFESKFSAAKVYGNFMQHLSNVVKFKHEQHYGNY